MRQLAWIVARAGLISPRPKVVAKMLDILPRSVRDAAAPRARRLLAELVEIHRLQLKKELESCQVFLQQERNLVRKIIELPKSCPQFSCVKIDAIGGFDWSKQGTWQEINSKDCGSRGRTVNYFNKRKETLNGTLDIAIGNAKDSLSRRKQRFRDAMLMRKEILRKVLQNGQEDVRGTIFIRRKILQDALQSRKSRFNDAEQKIKERSRLFIEDIRDTKNLMKEKMEEVVVKENIYTIPNFLCVTRILFSPYLGFLIVTGNFEYALGFMVVAGVSDWLDGWIARNFKSQSTKIGSFLDPMADKVLIGTLFLTLTYVDLIPVALTALIISRDIALVIAGFVIRYQSLPPPRTVYRYFDATHVTAQLAPTLISKINTGIQLALVGSTLAAPVFGYVGHPALDALCYVTAISTVLAASSYVFSKNTYKYFGQK